MTGFCYKLGTPQAQLTSPLATEKYTVLSSVHTHLTQEIVCVKYARNNVHSACNIHASMSGCIKVCVLGCVALNLIHNLFVILEHSPIQNEFTPHLPFTSSRQYLCHDLRPSQRLRIFFPAHTATHTHTIIIIYQDNSRNCAQYVSVWILAARAMTFLSVTLEREWAYSARTGVVYYVIICGTAQRHQKTHGW